MNFYQRALRYIQRTPTKTLLLVITFFLIGNLVILGLGVSQASDNAKILTRQKMRAVVSYEIDYEGFWKYADAIEDVNERDEVYKHYPKLDIAYASRLTEDERVLAYNYMISDIAYGIDFDHVPLGNEENKNDSYVDENGNTVTYKEPEYMLCGSRSVNMIELEEGTWQVNEGRFLNEEDIDQARSVAVITEELASQNNLRVGDTITVTRTNPNNLSRYKDKGINTDELNIDLDIIGIYSTSEDVDPNSESFRWMSPYESPKNKILIPMTTMSEFMFNTYLLDREADPESYRDDDIEETRESLNTPSQVYFLLDDPLHVDQFVADYERSLPEFQMLNANNETFKKMARPLDTMSFFANIVVWIVVVNAVVIISLVTALTLKTREYEIGVLLSIGVSKLIVVAQLFLELLLIAFVGFALASVSGSLMAGRVGDLVLDYQSNADAQYESEDDYYFTSSDSYFTEVTQDELFSQYHVSVSPLLIFEIFILGTGVVLISIVIPSAMIMRLNPKQILLQ